MTTEKTGQPIDWADIEPAYGVLTGALARVEHVLKERADLSDRQAHRHAFVALNRAVEQAVGVLAPVHDRAVFSAPQPVDPLDLPAGAFAARARAGAEPVCHFSLPGTMPPVVICGTEGSEDDMASPVLSLVTCPTCQEWIDRHVVVRAFASGREAFIPLPMEPERLSPEPGPSETVGDAVRRVISEDHRREDAASEPDGEEDPT